MKLIDFQEKVLGKDIKIFTVREFKEMMKLSKVAAQKILERYTKKGILVRLKKGLYMTKKDSPTTFFIANKLYQPSYISFETALSYYGLIPEAVYEIISSTTKPTRIFEVEGKKFVYHKIKREAYIGYETKKVNRERILMATPEKAFSDYLYFVHLGKKKLNERLNLKGLNKKKIKEYVKFYQRKNFYLKIKNDFLRKS
jgi:predicted transcriptional regulator of viral defense system